MSSGEGKSKLTEKQKVFIREYLVLLNAKQAAINAGYSEKGAKQMGHNLLQKDLIQSEIQRLNTKRCEKIEIDAQYVLLQAKELHERCMQDIRPLVNNQGEQQFDDDGNALYVFNAAGAAKSLEIIGRHVNVKAFQENTVNLKIEGLASRLRKAKRIE